MTYKRQNDDLKRHVTKSRNDNKIIFDFIVPICILM